MTHKKTREWLLSCFRLGKCTENVLYTYRNDKRIDPYDINTSPTCRHGENAVLLYSRKCTENVLYTYRNDKRSIAYGEI